MRRSTINRGTLHLGLLAALVGSIQCGGGGTPPPLVPPTISISGGNNQSGAVGTPLSTSPSVRIADASGNGRSGISVDFVVVSGGGSVTGGTQTTGSSGVATVGSWTLGTSLGANTLSATGVGTTGGPVTFTATGTVGPAATIAFNAGNNQTTSAGSAVAIAPSVKVTDVGGNPVTGAAVTFAIATGGGSITGGGQTTNSSGIATIGSWAPGTVGSNTLTATATGLTGSPVTFTATGTSAGALAVTSVSPSLLTPGITATIAGTGFNATPNQNTVTVDGVAATVSAATATQLTITIPSTLPCEATHDATISVTANAATGTTTKPLQVAKQRALAIGEALIVSTASEQRCNELSNTGTSRYYINVFNTNTTYSPTGASFQVRGAAGSGTAGGSPAGIASMPAVSSMRNDAAKRAAALRTTKVDEGDRLHLTALEASIRFLTEHRGELASRVAGRGASRSVAAAIPVVGDPMTLRVPNLTAANSNTICQNAYDMTGRVVYVGTKSIIVEDNANPMAGTIDTTYTTIGLEFDQTMFPILEANYGNPLAMDALTDNNQRIIMVFSRKVNDNMGSLAGFVVSCDFGTRNTSTNTQSNFGEYFYARVPLVSGTMSTTDSPPRWRWTMRGTIIHEVKHITSFAERISRGPVAFEASWLEETTARISEELYERAVYSFAQKANIGYGSAANPVGPYCGVRATSCGGKPRGIVRVFEELAPKWYAAPEDYSPLGRIDAADFSFYATGWSLVRWAIDHNTTLTEAAFLKALTQQASINGVPNLEARTGRTFADMLPEWTLAMVLDDYPSFTPALTRLTQPSWNLRNVFAGYKTDFPTSTWSSWPLVPWTRSFGAFTLDSDVVPGTASFIQLSGTQTAKQLIELKAQGSSAGAPSELRIAIVRVP